MKKDLFRIIDANLNRAREGLRVCEEVVRFIFNDAELTGEFKKIRHKVSVNIARFPGSTSALLKNRSSREDVGRDLAPESAKKSCQDVFTANSQRVKESLRVLEEFSGIFDAGLSSDFAKLRFRIYELEKKTIARF
ncbi:thiamine-phosphate pyrophosphorylase [Candidatus Omnitrophota bacterium]